MNTQSFYYYLKEDRLAQSSINEHINNLKRFNTWAEQESIQDIAHIGYNELLGFVEHLRKRELGIPTINTRLNSIRKYYEHLKEEGHIEINPAKRLFIKGAVKKIVQNPLTWQQLETLYHDYVQHLQQRIVREEKQIFNNLRCTVALSLMIWQAVHSGEMAKIESTHINLKDGTIYIPGTKRSKGRELKLHSQQIMPLHDYINKLPVTQTKLFDCLTYNLTTRLSNELKGINQQVNNVLHIRASVILHWLKMYDKRQVQYMIGHKWISSTEHYEVQEIEGLTDLLKKHHPFS